jgi:hypothetical protein
MTNTASSPLAYHQNTGSSLSRTRRTAIAFDSSGRAERPPLKREPMNTSKSARKSRVQADPLTPSRLDPSKAIRGKYYDRMQEGTNIVAIAPDLLDTFPDSEAVNEALRTLKRLRVASEPPARRKQRASVAS